MDECRLITRDLNGHGWMSVLPRVGTRDQVLATVGLAWNGPIWALSWTPQSALRRMLTPWLCHGGTATQLLGRMLPTKRQG